MTDAEKYALLIEALRWALSVIDILDQGYLSNDDNQECYDNALQLIIDYDKGNR